ncbi:NADP-dependent oxidoreductase domain-containing protein [Mucidula mucida]|nr:NADP-dependent oxidoreductase domain-containing protein [Mucidula mucida]
MAPTLTIHSTLALSTKKTIPILGFGVYRNPPSTCVASVLHALRAGYRHIDTAQFYENEAAVGEAVRLSGIPRAEVFITTKIQSKDFDRVPEAVDESLAALGDDSSYIDLVLLHEPYGGPVGRRKAWEALCALQGPGARVRNIGVSNFSERHIRELAPLPLPSVNQIELHPFCQHRALTAFCAAQGIVVSAFCPLVRGMRNENRVVKAIVEKTGKSPAQVMIRWALQKGYVPLPKSEKEDRIRENADVFGEWELTEQDMQRLDALDEGKKGSISWWPYDEE